MLPHVFADDRFVDLPSARALRRWMPAQRPAYCAQLGRIVVRVVYELSHGEHFFRRLARNFEVCVSRCLALADKDIVLIDLQRLSGQADKTLDVVYLGIARE